MSENYFYSSLSAQEIEDTLVGAVVFNSNQSLTTSQKEQARQNIGAGASDTKIIIEGFYDTLADLQSQIPVGTAGDVYAVGTASPYNLYIWDAISNTWKNNGAITLSDAVIDDEDIALDTTWSSSKIKNELDAIDLSALIDDSDTAVDTTWSSNKISTELSGKATPSDVAALVDDSVTSASKTWSSQKIAAEIANAFAVESVQITLSANGQSSSGNYLYRFGKLRIFVVHAVVKSGAASTSFNLGQLPAASDYPPQTASLNYDAIAGNVYHGVGRILIDTSGVISCVSSYGNNLQEAYGTIVWVVA